MGDILADRGEGHEYKRRLLVSSLVCRSIGCHGLCKEARSKNPFLQH